MDKKKDNKKKPLKLSSSGRLQIRKNLGPSGSNVRSGDGKKTIQIVFRNKNNQQKSSSTAKSNFRGSSTYRAPNSQAPNTFNQVPKNKFFEISKPQEVRSTPVRIISFILFFKLNLIELLIFSIFSLILFPLHLGIMQKVQE